MPLLQRLTACAVRGGPQVALRTYLVVLVLLATLPLAALFGFQAFVAAASDRARTQAEVSRAAAALSLALDIQLRASLDTLTALARSSLIQKQPPDQRQELLQEWLRLWPDWDSAFLLDRQGVPLALASSRQNADLQTTELQDIHHNVWRLQQPTASTLPDSHRPGGLAAVVLAVPVTGDGATLSYVLGIRMNPAAWTRLVNGAGLPAGASAGIFDEQKRPVAETLTSALVGAGALDAWQSVPLAGWNVRIATAAAPLVLPHPDAIVVALAIGGACLLAGVLLALWAAGRISHALRQLTGSAASQQGRIPVTEIASLRSMLLSRSQQDALLHQQLVGRVRELERIFDSIPMAMAFTRDPACVVVSQNAAMDQLLGPPGSVVSGLTQVTHRGRNLPPERQPLERAAVLGETTWSQELAISIDGRASGCVLATAVPLRDSAGQLAGAIMTAVDITGRKHVESQLLAADQLLRESQQVMEQAQNGGQVGFFDYHFAGDRMIWTSGQCRLFGIPSSQGGGLQQWFARIDASDRGRVERDVWTACALRRGTATVDYGVTRPNGFSHWLSSRIVLQYDADGRAARMVGVTVDMTQHQETEKERDTKIEQSLAAQRHAEDASRAKDEFLALLSHELRNPLGALSAASDVLKVAPAGGESASEARDIIARQIHYLSTLLNDLFDMGRVATGQMALARQSIDLADIVGRVHRTFLAGAATGHDVHLHLEESWIVGDALRLEQVVSHLLTKVIKTVPGGGRIDVSTRRTQDGGVFEVCNGVMPASQPPSLSDLLVQTRQPVGHLPAGFDIGLFLVRQLVELHGGTMRAETNEQGARFTLHLPAAQPPAACDADTLPASRRRKVLVIEDNRDVLAALRSKLELEGHSVSVAVNGIDGLTCLLEQRPEVSIVDIGLPGLTGFELARQARAAGYAGRMIAISGDGHERDAASALVAGFDDYLVKPVDRSQLRASLNGDGRS